MKKMMILIILAVAVMMTTAATVEAKSNYRWTSNEKWAFIDDYLDQIEYDGYRYPNLYAHCLQQAAAKWFPSYRAFIYASNGTIKRFVNSGPVFRCITEYGETWYD